ncbi:MAG TPA: DUF6754 domain-containing protein [Anaerolineae bacterium]|nr:DUF6754 domain-containing protein [Anaerolineae bacterium]
MEQIALVFLLLLLPALFFLAARVRTGKADEIRALPGMEELPGLIGRSAETGQPLHVSVGVAGVGGVATAETWAGLTVLGQLADDAAACDTPLIVTVADASVLPIAQDILRRAYARNGNPEGYGPTQVQLVAPDPMAYAAGVAGLLERESLTANVMIGSFGDEYLLMGETGARRGVHQIVGTADPRTLPFIRATADETLIGEEMFAGGAFAMRLPMQIASLLAEDWARWAVIFGTLLFTVFKVLL